MLKTIRDALSSQLKAANVSDDRPIDKEGLAKLYEDRFGDSLSDYQAQLWMNTLLEVNAATIGEVKQLVPPQQVIVRMREIYQGVWHRGDMPEYHTLFYGPKIMREPSSGYEQFRTEIMNQYDAIMQIGTETLGTC